jgi:lipopolysaccharide/colanic/teichoic acid biosynthesis glycosyltransferase
MLANETHENHRAVHNADSNHHAAAQNGQRFWRSDGSHQPNVLVAPTLYGHVKGAVDFLLALVLLVLFAPVLLVSAVLVRLTSRGPAFYAQARLGRNGRPFTLYKVRSMTHNCERDSGPRWSTPNDPRVTRVGRLLRKTHIDELPQLWNVLRGDMSLVGPRPERPEFIPVLAEAIPNYQDRLLVRPGVTGLAQVNLPADTDLASVRRKLAYDLYYIRHLSLWLDLRLMLCTGFHLMGISVYKLCRWFSVPYGNVVEQPPQARPETPHPAADFQSA